MVASEDGDSVAVAELHCDEEGDSLDRALRARISNTERGGGEGGSDDGLKKGGGRGKGKGNALVPSVDVVSHEQVVGVGRVSTDPEELRQVVLSIEKSTKASRERKEGSVRVLDVD